MDDGWKEFGGGPIRMGRNRLAVSLSKKGDLSLNGKAYEEMGRPETVTLHYHEKLNLIGLERCSELMPNAFTVKRKGSHDRWNLRVLPFVRYHDIRYDATVRFSTAEVRNGALILDLRKVEKVSHGPRGKYKRRR